MERLVGITSAKMKGLKWVGGLTMVLAMVVWAVGAVHSPYLSSSQADARHYLRTEARNADVDRTRVSRFAAAYWEAYPDVRQDRYFGPNGPLGIHGALEHFRRHGRQEGRRWPGGT